MHDQRAGGERHGAAVEDDLATRHPSDVAEPHDALDGAEAIELPRCRASASSPSWGRRPGRCGASPRRPRGGGTARRATRRRRPRPWCPPRARGATTGSGWTTARLSIHGSRGRTQTMRSGATPLASSQTMPSVAVFPEPTITKSVAAARSRRELVDGHDADVVGHDERRRRRRGDRRRQVRGVHDAASHVDLDRVPRHQRRHEVRRTVGVVLAAAEERDPARPEEAAVEDVVVVARSPTDGPAPAAPPPGRPAARRRVPNTVDATP